jgi:Right handed beta helix region
MSAVLAACSSTPQPSATTRTTHPGSSAKTAPTPVTPSAVSGAAITVPVPSGAAVSPPSNIASDCSADVSVALKAWFKSLRPDQTVVMRPGACYEVNEGIKLKKPQGLTVYGGEYRSTVVPSDLRGQPASQKGQPVFTVLGGSHVTLESMHIEGANPGGYHPRLAFAGGIELEGTADALVRGVTIDHTYGDGITLAPLRGGANHNSGTIIGPTANVTVDGVTVDGAGRQGLTFASVDGAQVRNVVLKNLGLDTFDFESDQTGEGASNVTIDGCLASGGAIFFANGGASNAASTHDITVEHCTMAVPQAGSAILVVRHGSGGKTKRLRGPFLFESDVFRCGASAYVGCVQLHGANVTISDSHLLFPPGTVHEAVYGLSGATAAFSRDVAEGYGRTGSTSGKSHLHISGGVWTPAGRGVNTPRTNS